MTGPVLLAASIPSPSGHVIVIDADGDGWLAWCIPHGPVAAGPEHRPVFTAAVVHDDEHGGGWR